LHKQSELVASKEMPKENYKVKKGGASAPIHISGHHFHKVKSEKNKS